MMSARHSVITLLCLLGCVFSLLSSVAFAATERLEVQIRSTILNIRETTSTQSPIVDALQQGDIITVTTTGLADWIRLDDGRGYISIHYVDVLSRTPVIESPAEIQERAARQATQQPIDTVPATSSVESVVPPAPEAQPLQSPARQTAAPEPEPQQALEQTATAESSQPVTERTITEQPELIAPEPAEAPKTCTVGPDNSDLQISSIATTCRKNLKTLYYEACEVAFNLEFNSSCEQAGDISVTCSAVAQTTNLNQVEEVAELHQEATIYLKESASSRQKLLWMPASPQQQITDIQLRQKHCILN